MRRLGMVALFIAHGLSAQAEPDTLTIQQAKARFAKADRALTEAWTAAKKSVVPQLAAELAERQRDWVNARKATAVFDSGVHKSEARTSPEVYQLMAEATERRTDFLRRVATQTDTTMTGIWHDGWNTTVRILEQNDRLLFEFEVPGVAALAGVAAWNERIGWFSDRGKPYQETREANICFLWHGWKMEVVSANTRHYFDRRSGIDRTYYKVGSLTKEDEAALTGAAEAGEYNPQ